MKRLTIDPLTRVEGHGRVDLEIEGGRLRRAQVSITEAPRFFEALVAGRAALEVPALVCRICAICSAAHRVAAARAVENAWQVEVPEAARVLRELLLLGGHIESHALHLFCLILPDIEGGEDILQLLRAGSARARQGLELKRLGNRMQEIAGGRAIHPVNVEVGGMVFFPARDKLASLLGELASWQQDLADLLAPFGEAAAFPAGVGAIGVPLSLPQEPRMALQGDALVIGGGAPQGAEWYRDLLTETPVGYSNALRSLHHGQPVLSGALARRCNRAGGEAETRGAAGIHGNNSAQAQELQWALAAAHGLVRELLALPDEVPLAAAVRPGPGGGTGLVDAPRGLLIHHFEMDDSGRVARADVLTPTAINQAAMEAQLLADLAVLTDQGEMTRRAERIIRAYDPCISCSVHVVRI